MIELRWLERKSDKYPPDWAGYEQVLQYRQKVDTTIRAGLWTDKTDIIRTADYQWSEWMDVPKVNE